LCSKVDELKDEFLDKLKIKLLELEDADDVAHEVIQIISDIKVYLEGRGSFVTNQQKIGFKQLFHGFIIKDWFDEDEHCERYHK